jgi:hypothetical protein
MDRKTKGPVEITARMRTLGVLAISVLVLVGCQSFQKTNVLPPRPDQPIGIPDLTKGEGPAVEQAREHDWFLQLGDTRGWAYRNQSNSCDDARQILVTKVPKDSSLNEYLNPGDVILGVNGRYFSKNPIKEFRETSRPTQRAYGAFDVIVWRKGWEKEKLVTLDLRFQRMDFTKGAKPGKADDMNLGPTGARGWMEGLNEHSYVTRQIYVTSVEKRSPADGVLQEGDVILGIGSTEFDSDARKAFGQAIAVAESEQGQGDLRLLRWRDGKTETVTIKLPVFGSPNDKSDAIVKNACDYLISNNIISRGKPLAIPKVVGALALMSTGDPNHMALAKEHVYKIIELTKQSGEYPPVWVFSGWSWGYANLLLTEYYLLTEDANALPAIEKFSTRIAMGQSGVGTWGHNMATSNHGYCNGYGAMNQCGNTCLMSLILAQKCGIDNAEIRQAVRRGQEYLKQFVDLEPEPYGDHPRLLWPAHDDNGKCSSAAVLFSLAEESYAATYYTRMTVASYDVREKGHTGNWWSMLWGPLGAERAGKAGCAAFLHEMAWLHDLERRWDGGFVYQGKVCAGTETTKNWDTTGCRILMYALSRKRLHITGRSGLTDLVAEKDVAGLIEDGCRPPVDTDRHENKYDHLSERELLEKLKSWSPVVRYCAALSLAKKETVNIDSLITMLQAEDRYAKQGACGALRELKRRGKPAVEPLIIALASDDPLVVIHAATALGAIGDKRAVEPLLKMAAGEIKNDPRGIVRRFVIRALCLKSGAFSKTNGLLVDSLDGVDRSLLYPAVERMLQCPSGFELGCVSSTILKKLSFEELQPLWPVLIPKLRNCAMTDIMFASTIRQDIAQILADNKVKEGMSLLVEYFKVQKGHGSRDRSKFIAEQLYKYGASAKPILPELEACIDYFKQPREHVDRGQPGPGDMYKARGSWVVSVIKNIKESKDTPALVSIRPYLEARSKDTK